MASRKGIFGLFAPKGFEKKSRDTKKDTIPDHTVCRYCGTKNEQIAMFCKRCGKRLSDTAEKTPVSPYVIGGLDYDPYPVAGEQGGTIPTHIGEEIAIQPEPYLNDDSIRREIDRVGKTIGKETIEADVDASLPVTGWMVGVAGQAYGKCYILKSGMNRIGLSAEMDAVLLSGEENLQRTIAIIVYDGENNAFLIRPGENDGLCYVNDSVLYEQMSLTGYETIAFGEGGLNVFKFVPFCGEQFSWSSL